MEKVFLYADLFKNSGSTILRCYQIVDKLNERGIPATYTTDFNDIRKSIIVLTKNFLKIVTLPILKQLKDNGNLVICDFVDDIISEAINYSDCVIFCTNYQLQKFKNAISCNKVVIPHHWDERITGVPELDELKIGYFGELVNTKYHNIPVVTFHRVDTFRGHYTDWLDSLKLYNCHYAIRNARSIDGSKPFTKGSVAAACNSNILCSKTDFSAVEFLDSDYPYMIEDDTIEEVMQGIKYIKKTFKKDEWYKGLDIMKMLKHETSLEKIIDIYIELFDEMEKRALNF